MFNECGITGFEGWGWGGIPNPAFPTFAGFGFDPTNYIATAQLVPSPYTSVPLIQARLGGLARLIEAVDDSQPPTGSLQPNGPAYATLQSVIQNVTTEINGFLASIYPIPLAQTKTVAIAQVTGLTTDGTNGVASIQMLNNGNYLTAPNVANTPAYLRFLDPLANAECWGPNWQNFFQNYQQGTGLVLNVAYTQNPFSDESGNVIQMNQVNGVPTITTPGTNYNLNDILVLTGGSSIVPAEIREAALILICHSLYMRRNGVDEKNPFNDLAHMRRGRLIKISNGEDDAQLDGTFKRFFSAGACWGTRSVMNGANSL